MKETYCSIPKAVLTFPVGGKTDVILRKNIEKRHLPIFLYVLHRRKVLIKRFILNLKNLELKSSIEKLIQINDKLITLNTTLTKDREILLIEVGRLNNIIKEKEQND